MKFKFFSVLLSVMLYSLSNKAQKDSSCFPINVDGYLEMYYNFNHTNPKSNNALFYMVNHDRTNELAVNLAYIRAAYEKNGIKANFGLMAGTYSNSNMVLEPGTLKNLYEANVGLKASRKKDLWIYAGVFSSHLGPEGPVGRDCPTLTRSLMGEGSPYYESGLKVDYGSDNKKWKLSGFLINGWQHIQKPKGNFIPSFGSQITFTPSDKILFNSSTFIGTDKPDSLHCWRFFHDFYSSLSISKSIALFTAFDIGAERKLDNSNGYNSWYSFSGIVKFSHSQKIYSSYRVEYFHDPKGVIFHYPNRNGFNMAGYSMGLNMQLISNVLLRMEIKYLDGKGNRLNELQSATSNFLTSAALCVTFK